MNSFIERRDSDVTESPSRPSSKISISSRISRTSSQGQRLLWLFRQKVREIMLQQGVISQVKEQAHINKERRKSQHETVTAFSSNRDQESVLIDAAGSAVGRLAFSTLGSIIAMLMWIEVRAREGGAWKEIMTEAAAGMNSAMCLANVYWLYRYYDIQRQLRIFRYLAWPDSSLREARLLPTFLAEIFLCGLHLPPGSEFALGWLFRQAGSEEIPTDSFEFFVFIAFCRVYTFPRILLYRGAFISTKIRFLGSLNNVEFDVIFVLRSYLRLFPVRTISFGLLTTILISGYSLQLCEADHSSEDEDHLYVLTWMYYVCGNMLGFDPRIYPSTYCGRFITVFSSIWSTLILSTLIAVIAQGLELNFAESKVVDNMKYDQVTWELHRSAVQAMQRAWRSYKRDSVYSQSCWPQRIRPKKLTSLHSKLTKGHWYSTDLMEALHKLKKARRKFKAVKEADIMCTILEEVYQVKHLSKEVEAKIRSVESKQRAQLSSLGSNNRRNGMLVHYPGPGEAPWTAISPDKEKGMPLHSVTAPQSEVPQRAMTTGRERAHTLQANPGMAANCQLHIRTGAIVDAEAGFATGTAASGSQLEQMQRTMKRLEEKLDKVARELDESRQPTSAQTVPKSSAAAVPNEYVEALKRLEEKMSSIQPSFNATSPSTPNASVHKSPKTSSHSPGVEERLETAVQEQVQLMKQLSELMQAQVLANSVTSTPTSAVPSAPTKEFLPSSAPSQPTTTAAQSDTAAQVSATSKVEESVKPAKSLSSKVLAGTLDAEALQLLQSQMMVMQEQQARALENIEQRCSSQSAQAIKKFEEQATQHLTMISKIMQQFQVEPGIPSETPQDQGQGENQEDVEGTNDGSLRALRHHRSSSM